MAVELVEHAGHGADDGQPFVNLERAVDAHADEEDNKVAIKLGGEAFVSDHVFRP